MTAVPGHRTVSVTDPGGSTASTLGGDPAGNLGRIGIVGTGQIGTMLGMALLASRAGSVAEVSLFDARREVAARSLARGAGTRVAGSVAEAVEADIVILALPVPAICAFLEDQGPRLGPGTLVIDTGSAKRAVVDAMRRCLSPEVHGVGGHPMVGTERPGPDGARPDKLPGSVFVLCPVREGAAAMDRAIALVASLGARSVLMDAQAHDAAVARVSHLPHVIAFALSDVARTAAAEGRPSATLASSGYRGATRLAASDPAVVAGFLAANAEEVRLAAQEFRTAMDTLLGALDRGADDLADRLRSAVEEPGAG